MVFYVRIACNLSYHGLLKLPCDILQNVVTCKSFCLHIQCLNRISVILFSFLSIVERLPTYGIHFYDAKVSSFQFSIGCFLSFYFCLLLLLYFKVKLLDRTHHLLNKIGCKAEVGPLRKSTPKGRSKLVGRQSDQHCMVYEML